MVHRSRSPCPGLRLDAPEKGLNVDPANWQTHFREATWDEALDVAAAGMKGRGREIAGYLDTFELMFYRSLLGLTLVVSFGIER